MCLCYEPTTVKIAKNIKEAPTVKVKLVSLILGAACLTSVLLACNGGTSEGEAVTHYHAGVGTQDEGRLQERIEEYDQVIRQSPQNANAYLTRGDALNDLEQYQRAIEDYGEVIRLDSNLALAYNNRGITFLNMGSYQRAIQDLDEAVRLDPQYAPAYNYRAISNTYLGNDEEARQDVERGVEAGLDRAAIEAALVQIQNTR